MTDKAAVKEEEVVAEEGTTVDGGSYHSDAAEDLLKHDIPAYSVIDYSQQHASGYPEVEPEPEPEPEARKKGKK